MVMEASAPPPPTTATNRPAMRPTAVVPQAAATWRPTTSWELWISNNKNPDNNEEGDVTTDPTLGDAVNVGNYTPSNGTDSWFNPSTWGDRPEEPEEEGVLDKITNFWDNDDDSAGNAMESSRNEVVFLLSVVVAWAVLL